MYIYIERAGRRSCDENWYTIEGDALSQSGRRIPYVSFQLFTTCGVILHQNYNQLFAVADTPIAEKARDKRLLGYHDIRIGNEPNERLIKFITTNLPKVAPAARAKFDSYKDLLSSFAFGTSFYDAFTARVRRRSQGQNEDFDRF